MILGILQARCSSTRLPGKVLLPILGKPMLARQLERLRLVRQIDKLVVATSLDPSDDMLAELCAQEGVSCFRGELDDVLSRFYHAAHPFQPKNVVRLTGDCPLADPELIDRMITFFLAGDYDYCSNCLEPSFPDGLDAEIFSFSCLENAWREAVLPSQREHVTPFINQQPLRFKLACMKSDTDLSHLRWTVDEPADFQLVTQVYEALYPQQPNFGMKEILSLLEERPQLLSLNGSFKRNEGFQKSLEKDENLQASISNIEYSRSHRR